MARYIDAEKIDFSMIKNNFDRARATVMVMATPTADVVEVRHGEWASEENPFFQAELEDAHYVGMLTLLEQW